MVFGKKKKSGDEKGAKVLPTEDRKEEDDNGTSPPVENNQKTESNRKENPKKKKEKKKEKKKKKRRHGDIILKNELTIQTVLKYQLGQKDLKLLKQWFINIDRDRSGTIDFDEFFEHIDESRTHFTESMFKLSDADDSGYIDYDEFVCAVTAYCMFTRDEILKFAFDSFDVDGSGSIDEDEFRRLCSVVNNGKPTFPGSFERAIKSFDTNGDGLIDFDEFQVINKRYPLILFPCFRLQDKLQKSTLGEKHWLKLHQRYFQWLKLQIYKRKHNGAEPPLSSFKKFKRLFGIGKLDIYQP